MPTVLNRHHFKGKTLPAGAVYVGRGTPLGNPFTVEDYGPEALELYRGWLKGKEDRHLLRADRRRAL